MYCVRSRSQNPLFPPIARATLQPKSKFHGNSASTIIDGDVSLMLHNFDEVYTVNFPTVLARGLIWSTQCLEVYDRMTITCEKSGYRADLNFPTKVHLHRLRHALHLCVHIRSFLDL